MVLTGYSASETPIYKTGLLMCLTYFKANLKKFKNSLKNNVYSRNSWQIMLDYVSLPVGGWYNQTPVERSHLTFKSGSCIFIEQSSNFKHNLSLISRMNTISQFIFNKICLKKTYKTGLIKRRFAGTITRQDHGLMFRKPVITPVLWPGHYGTFP